MMQNDHKSIGKFKVYPVIVIFLQVYPSLLSVAKPFYKNLSSLLLFFLSFLIFLSLPLQTLWFLVM